MDVLVVDDDPEIRRIVRRVLEREGINVTDASDGPEAVAVAAATHLDLVVLDLHMPGMTGLELLAELRALQPRLHLIMLTAAGSEPDRVLGIVSGADDYMVKPFSARELAVRVLAVRRRLAASDPNGASGPTDPPARSNPEAAIGATVVAVGSTITYANHAALELLGATKTADLVGHDVFEFVAPRSVGATHARHESARAGLWPRPELMTLLRLDGEEVLVELASAPVVWEGTPASQMSFWEVAADSSRLRELATGIRTHVRDAVIVSDVDLRIQSFNEAAEELYGWREEEVVGRPITDVIVPDGGRAGFEQMQSRLERKGRWHGEVVQRRRDGSEVRVRASTTLLRDSGGTAVGLVEVNRPVTHDTGTSTGTRSVGDDSLDEEIRTGVEDEQFTVHYQPIVRLTDGHAVGVEALVRWHHPERGLLPPVAFIEAAERSGAIVDLGHHVLREACRQWATWRHAGHDLSLSVNLSGRQLADADLPDRLAEVMDAMSIPAGSLWMEVTETSLVQDLDQATCVLHRINDLGAHVAIDDFGTGWASLTYLRQFPVQALKIDRVFVTGLGTDSRDTAIVSSMISLGRELELSVVAEGIETAEQRDHLLELGCDVGQGFLYSGPHAPEELDLRDRASRW